MGPNPVWLLSSRKGEKRHKDRHTEGRQPCEDGYRDRRDAATKAGLGDQKLEEAREEPPLEVLEGASPCPHLGFGLGASRTGIDWVSIAISQPVCSTQLPPSWEAGPAAVSPGNATLLILFGQQHRTGLRSLGPEARTTSCICRVCNCGRMFWCLCASVSSSVKGWCWPQRAVRILRSQDS